MTAAFRSIGTPNRAFNSPTTPGSPAGFQAGDILICGFVETAGTNAPPDLSSFGFTRKSINGAGATAAALYTKTALGSDAMPSAQFGSDWCLSFCAAYTGLTETLDKVSVERGTNQTSGIGVPGSSAPPSNNVVAIALGMRNNGSASGVSISNYGNFIQRATSLPPGTGQVLAVFQDVIMTTPQTVTLGSQNTSPADSAAQTTATVIIFLQPLNATIPPGDDEFPIRFPAKPYSKATQEFWQIPIELATLTPPGPPPPIAADFPVPRRLSLSISLRSIELNLLSSTLFGQDRVLAPNDWCYEWDKPSLPVAISADSYPLGPLELTVLTTYAPYSEYNWPVPSPFRQTLKSFESSLPLTLYGRDQILTAGIQNNMWDPPSARRRPNENLSQLNSGLSLFFFTPLKPPLSVSDWPVPRPANRIVQDFISGTSAPLLKFLTTYSPFQASQDLPVRRAPRLNSGISWSSYPILRGADVLPPGGRVFADIISKPRSFRSLLSIESRSIFLSTGPQPPISGKGKHMGRVILPAVFVGESVVLDQFDFLSGLQPSETLVGANATISLYSGTDPNPQALFQGISVSGSKALVQILPQILGNVYYLVVRVSTSASQVLELTGYLAIGPMVP